MSALYILAQIDGCNIAVNSDCVESIFRIQDVIPVPKSRPEVAGLFALRSRVLTLIDCQVIISGQKRDSYQNLLAIVTEIGGHSYGLIVDAVEDVAAIDASEMQKNIDPGSKWQALVSAVIPVNDRLVMVLEPERLVEGQLPLAA